MNGLRTGALVLVRDVTELRHRERELMTKDATIREIHHRVKNNLQTVAALLRLQARRMDAPEGRAALDEAVRRVGSIATVHETLSHTPEEIVDFDEVAERVAAMAGEVSRPRPGSSRCCSAGSGCCPRRWRPAGPGAGRAAAERAAARPGPVRGGGAAGLLEVAVNRGPDRLTVSPRQRRRVPDEFDLDSATSLGLQIVRTLVVSELGGRLEVKPRAGGGTKAVVDLPLDPGAPLSAGRRRRLARPA